MMHKRAHIPKLEQLPTAQRDALVSWLTVERLTYTDARRRLKSEFGVSASPGTLTAFWHNVCQPREFAARAQQVNAADKIGRLLLHIEVRAMPDQSLSISVRGPAHSSPGQIVQA